MQKPAGSGHGCVTPGAGYNCPVAIMHHKNTLLPAGECGMQTPGGALLNVGLARHDISDMAGTARETAIRVMDKPLRGKE